MRKLASIQKIKALAPIPNADTIMRAAVLGWELVVKKGEFEVGDLCVYCEIDCILPDRPEFEFLKNKAMRIRTIRLRGQISQGICFPLSILPEGTEIVEGKEVTELLEITKYEPPIPASLSGVMKGKFPSFMPKTDETRVQVLEDLLKKYEGEDFYIAEKLDGSSVTYYLRDGEFGVCSRNLELLESEENTLWKFARAQKIEENLRALGKNYAIQGEMIGEGIQSNKYKLRGQEARFFNVFDIDEYCYLGYEAYIEVIKNLGLKTVPILDTDYKLESDIPTLVKRATAHSTLYKVQQEGLVLRPLKELRDREGRLSFKVINPKFLLKFE